LRNLLHHRLESIANFYSQLINDKSVGRIGFIRASAMVS
jgi:hypothetical protein